MAITLGTLRPRVQRRMSAHDTDSLLTPDVIDDFVNIAVIQVSNEADWPWLFTDVDFSTVVGQTAYGNADGAIPADWQETDSIVDTTDGTSLSQRSIQELDTVIYPGTPRIYAVYEDKLQLKPTPSDVRTIKHRYVRSEKTLTGDQDTLYMPDGLGIDEGVIEYASHLGLRFLREDVRAASALQTYDRWLKRSLKNRMRSREPKRIRVRPGSML